MKCRFCGTNLPDDARFCSGCGREIERENVSAKEKNNNETEDAYYREIDDKEYEEIKLSLIHISEPTRPRRPSRMPSSA